MLLAINFPSWLSPEIIPGLPMRWYGLMYILAFGVAYLLFRKQVRDNGISMTEDDMSGMFFWAILSLLLGARIFATLVYDTSGMYIRKPWLMFWPFEGSKFVGLQGMSYHGGLIGAIIGVMSYCIHKKWNIREIGDMLVTGIPLGYTFGRLGNFINGELYGRVTSSPLGMIFPHAQGLSTKEGWVQQIASEAGLPISENMNLINLPRHPSQLYEALFEGVVLWAILWFLRKHRPFRGFIIGLYMIGYGIFRFFIEYFREPDWDIGYRIELVKTDLPPAIFSSFLNFTTGQILCFLMVIGGILWLFIAAQLPNGEPIPSITMAQNKEQPKTTKNQRRKLRKKLK